MLIATLPITRYAYHNLDRPADIHGEGRVVPCGRVCVDRSLKVVNDERRRDCRLDATHRAVKLKLYGQ
jgi:hypothetical protein